MNHKWKWWTNNGGTGACVRCGLRAKTLKRVRERPSGYGPATKIYVAVYRSVGSDAWSEMMPKCFAPHERREQS